MYVKKSEFFACKAKLCIIFMSKPNLPTILKRHLCVLGMQNK